MPQIQDPELSNRLRRKFGIVGNVIDTLAPEIVGVVVVDDVLPQVGREEGMLAQVITGDTGDIPEAGLRNMDQTKALVIDQIQWSTPNTGTIVKLRLGSPNGTELAAAIGQVRDFRGQSLLSPAHAASAQNFNTVTGGGTIIWSMTCVANTPYDIFPNLVLAPAGTIVGVNVERDVVHMEIQFAAAILRVVWFYHFVDPPLQARR